MNQQVVVRPRLLADVITLDKEQRNDFFASLTRGMTVEKAIQGKSLYHLMNRGETPEEKNKSKGTLVFVLGQMLTYQLSQFNITNTMDDLQIMDFIEEYVIKYDTNSLEDLMMCVKLGSEGRFGKDFNRSDAPTLWRWMTLYDERHREPALIENGTANKKTIHDMATDKVGVMTEELKKRYGPIIPEKDYWEKKQRAETFDDQIEETRRNLHKYDDDEVGNLFFFWWYQELRRRTYTKQEDEECTPIVITYEVGKGEDIRRFSYEGLAAQGVYDEMLCMLMEDIERREGVTWDNKR